MRLHLWTVLLTVFAFSNTQAAPVLYEYSAFSYLEVRGDPSTDIFLGVNNNQTFFAPGTEFSGTFYYDADTPVTPFGPTLGISFGAITNVTGSVGGYNFTDPTQATLMENGTFQGTQDYFGIIGQDPVGVTTPAADDLAGFNLIDGEGTEFSLFNSRGNNIQGLFGNDFITNPFVNFADLSDIGAVNTLTNIALDFLQVNPDGSLNESIQHTVFFNGGYLRQANVSEPGTVVLMTFGLIGLGIMRRKKLS